MQTPTEQSGFIPPEPEKSLNHMARYILKRRIGAENWIKSSVDPYADRHVSMGYEATLIDAAAKLVEQFEIDGNLFKDDRYAEAFTAICDSYQYNEAHKHNETYEIEKQFIEQATRLLAGNSSRFNVHQYHEGQEHSECYVDYPVGIDGETVRIHKAVTHLTDLESSTTLEQMIKNWDETSPVHVSRESLNITSAEVEKPFKVRVIQTSKDATLLNQTEVEQWDAVAGESVTMFAYEDPDDNIPIIVMSQDDFNDLINGDEDRQQYLKKAIAHEYAHTQRYVRMGARQALGLFHDERVVITASNSSGHEDTLLIFQFMHGTERNEQGKPSLWDTLERVIKSQDDIAQYFRHISDTFGFRSLLLTLAVKPKNYTEFYGITEIPGIRMNPAHRSEDLLVQVLEQREIISPGSRQHLLNRLKKASPRFAHGLFVLANYEAHMQLPDDINEVIQCQMELDTD